MNLRDVIKDAERRKIAIGHFNIGNLEQLKAISHVGARLNVPIIIGVSEGEREYLGVHHVVDFIRSYNDEHAKESGFHLFLNADHTHSLDKVREAAEAGFDAILFDGGKLSLEENTQQTKEAVSIIRAIDPSIIIEAELGYIGSASEIRKEIPKGAAINLEDLTKPEEAKRFVKATGIDMLAPAVGNIHGMFAHMPDPALNIERIRAIKEAVSIPLVLHGGSGNSNADFLAAIDAGVSIIHISTELRYIWRKELEEVLKEHPEEIAPYKMMPAVIAEIERVVEEKVRLFSRIK
ncbi:MAG: class II fructose-bisphosphate aldolase [Candidatus Paceibacterota bacterium]|jgi:fructose-bisphosphate aldolase class II